MRERLPPSDVRRGWKVAFVRPREHLIVMLRLRRELPVFHRGMILTSRAMRSDRIADAEGEVRRTASARGVSPAGNDITNDTSMSSHPLASPG